MNEIRNGVYEDDFGGTYFYLHGKLHREDGPALETSEGFKYWYTHGILHREDGPAVQFPISMQWYFDGERHREDGPAIENKTGTKSWWINGVQYTQEEFNHWKEKKHLNEKLHATLEQRPSIKCGKI